MQTTRNSSLIALLGLMMVLLPACAHATDCDGALWCGDNGTSECNTDCRSAVTFVQLDPASSTGVVQGQPVNDTYLEEGNCTGSSTRNINVSWQYTDSESLQNSASEDITQSASAELGKEVKTDLSLSHSTTTGWQLTDTYSSVLQFSGTWSIPVCHKEYDQYLHYVNTESKSQNGRAVENYDTEFAGCVVGFDSSEVWNMLKCESGSASASGSKVVGFGDGAGPHTMACSGNGCGG